MRLVRYGLVIAIACCELGRPVPVAAQREVAGSMVVIPAGEFAALYGTAGAPRLQVASFKLDRDPVTRGEYLAFVRRFPMWRRDQVKALFADRAHYLEHWPAPLDAGSARDLRRPVTGVSWFAARAYCAAQGKRLPTVAEWEYAAIGLDQQSDAGRSRFLIATLITTYARRTSPPAPVDSALVSGRGLRGMHDLVWEWVEDFNSVLVADDSRGVGARQHDLFCASAAIGATDPNNFPAFLRYAVRAGASANSTMSSLGFRCAA